MLQWLVPRIAIFDTHDAAYYIWKKAAIADAAIIHVDAHHDLFEISDLQVPCASNYLRWSLKEGIAREIYWVVPDPTWESRAGLENIRTHLKILAITTGGGRYWFKPDERIGRVMLYGRPVTACCLQSLPSANARVLLDIDVDYLLLREPAVSSWHDVPDRPWMWPANLAGKLADLSRRAEKVTICYSVEGGYTPVIWKHLGDDIAAVLAADQPDRASAYVELKRSMAEALLDGERAKHAELRQAAEDENPLDASLHQWRALADLRAGKPAEAREAYFRAVELDTAYASSIGKVGLVLEARGDLERAEKIYAEATELNERDALGWYGLGRIALRKNNRPAAKISLGKASSLPDAPAEVHRELAMLAEAEGDREEALNQYRAYLRLSFAGRSLERPITAVRQRDCRSPFWAEGYSALARLYSAQGNSHLATNCHSQALRLMNPCLHQAARLILQRAAGATKISAAQVAVSLAKSLAVCTRLGAQRLHRKFRGKLKAIRWQHDPSARAGTRICPPIPVCKASTPAKNP
ncbi:MAG TPA: hypothetical protein VMX94_06315 [Armatimonadota bacterium]|nr:hypothetical protein [Armatimonadota bacterium]